MSIDLLKETVGLRELKMNTSSAVLVEGDVIVPDVKPDIREVLLAEATAEVRSQELSGNRLTVLGVIRLKILYVPESESEYSPKLKSMSTTFEFRDELECSAGSSAVSVCAETEHVSFSVLNSRKLNIKVAVSLKIKAYAEKEIDLCTDVSAESGLEKKMTTINLYRTVAQEEKELNIAESLEIPLAQPEIDEILKMDISVAKLECKPMNRKILLKGNLRVRCLYSSVADGYSVEHAEYEIPFTEVEELEGLEEACLCDVRYNVKDFNFAAKEDADGEMRVIALEVFVCADISAAKTTEREILADCYSPRAETLLTRESVLLDELIYEGNSHLSVRETMSVPEDMPQIDGVYSLTAKPLLSEMRVENDSFFLRGKLVVFLLYASQESETEINSLVQEFPFEQSISVGECDGELALDGNVSVTSDSFTLNAASEVEIRCNLEFYSKVIRPRKTEIVTACELCENETESLQAPSLMIYFVQPGDSMWDIAKRYRTTYGAIMTANHLEDSTKLSAGQKLLIPGH